MRKATRAFGQVLSHAAFGLLVVVSCANAQAPIAPVAPAADQAKAEAAPPAFPKKFYHPPGSKFYVPAGIPLRMGFALGGASPDSGQGSADVANESSVTLKEGPNSLQFGPAAQPVIADGTPPKTALDVQEKTQVEHDGIRVLAPAPKLHITAIDALSGVAQTLVSIDGAPFVPLPAGGPVVTAEGEHRLRYFSVDNVGNPEKPQEYVFRIDNTPPVTRLTVTGPRSEAVIGVGGAISLAADDAFAGVQDIHYRLDGGSELTYERTLQLDELPEGPHKLQFHATDRVANVEPAHAFDFVVDRKPPVISLVIHGPLFAQGDVRYVAPKATVELAATDGVAGETPLNYRIDAAAANSLYTAPFQLPAASGIHIVRMESEDKVGNHVVTTASDIYVDLTPPKTEVDFSRPFFTLDGDTVLNPASKITLNSSDFESGIDAVFYSVDGGAEQKYAEPFSVTEEGRHKLSFFGTDHVGNRETEQTVSLRIQPATPGVAAAGSSLDQKRFYLHPKLGLIGPEGLPFVLRISDSPKDGALNFLMVPDPAVTTPAAAAAPSSIDPLTFGVSGPNKLKIAVAPPKSEVFALSIDNSPPKTQLASIGARKYEANGVTYFGPGLKISLSAQDDPGAVASGVWKTLYSQEGSGYATYSKPLDSFSREGHYTLRYYSLDNVGNAETPHTFLFTVDTAPPKTHLNIRGAHLSNTVAPTTRIQLETTDNLSGVAAVQYRIDDGEPHNYSEPFAVGALSEGGHRLRYQAVDQVGNREDEHNWPFTVERNVASASLEVRGNSLERGGTVFVASGSLLVLKAPEGASVVYTWDNDPAATYSKPIPVPEAGVHRLTFHSVDDVGNVSSSHIYNVTTDKVPPSSRVHFEGPQLNRESGILISGNTKIVIETNAGAVGAASIQYSLGGIHWQPYTGPFTIKTSTAVDLAFRGSNPLLSLEPIQHQHFVVDASGPVITVSYSDPVTSAGDSVVLAPGTLLFVAAEDLPAGLQKITCRIDDQPETIYRSPLSGFSPGKVHTVVISAEDLLGNHSVKTIHLQVKERAR